MCCPPELPFFIKITIFDKTCPLKLHNLLYIFICTDTSCQYINIEQTVLYPTIFLLYERISVFYYICVQEGHTSLVYRHEMKLNFSPVIPRIKELRSAELTSSRGRCIHYRPDANFY